MLEGKIFKNCLKVTVKMLLNCYLAAPATMEKMKQNVNSWLKNVVNDFDV